MSHVWSNVLCNGIGYELRSHNTIQQAKYNGGCGFLDERRETKNNKTQERRPQSQLTAQCTRGTSKKETMGDVSTFNF